ncbi:MAG: pre-peptidase C-terminal domain-containing protein, partial [Phycisphaerae bacterium]|nr:pre-peptidase C-terminal domain-containing protein [Gemmatimonadaceae bacterium]
MNGANHSGTITLNDIDPWTITAAAGERIIVSLAETGVFNATFQPQIRVSGPTGAQVAQNTQQFQAAQVDFYAPTAGTYTIVVGSFDLNGTG